MSLTTESVAADLRSLAPDVVEGQGPERIWPVIDLARSRLSEKAFGGQYRLAVAYMAAHMLTLAQAGRDGPLASRTVGDYSESFATAQGSESLESTKYGREYLRIQRSAVFTPRTRMVR